MAWFPSRGSLDRSCCGLMIWPWWELQIFLHTPCLLHLPEHNSCPTPRILRRLSLLSVRKKWFVKQHSMNEVPGIQHSPQSWGFWELQYESACGKGESHVFIFPSCNKKNMMGSREACILFLALVLLCCKAPGKPLILSGLSFLHPQNGDNTVLPLLLWWNRFENQKIIGIFLVYC